MAMPALTPSAARLYDALTPMVGDDASYGYPAATFCAALATMFDQIASLVNEGPNGEPAWASLWNPDTCPAALLPFIGQFVGVSMPPSLTVAQQRLRIKQTAGFQRGTPDAIVGAARQFLVGPDGTGATAIVRLVERNGSPYAFSVVTRTSQTPDQAAVLRALNEQKPAGLVMTYTVSASETWDEITPGLTWDAVNGALMWDDLATTSI